MDCEHKLHSTNVAMPRIEVEFEITNEDIDDAENLKND